MSPRIGVMGPVCRVQLGGGVPPCRAPITLVSSPEETDTPRRLELWDLGCTGGLRSVLSAPCAAERGEQIILQGAGLLKPRGQGP